MDEDTLIEFTEETTDRLVKFMERTTENIEGAIKKMNGVFRSMRMVCWTTVPILASTTGLFVMTLTSMAKLKDRVNRLEVRIMNLDAQLTIFKMQQAEEKEEG